MFSPLEQFDLINCGPTGLGLPFFTNSLGVALLVSGLYLIFFHFQVNANYFLPRTYARG